MEPTPEPVLARMIVRMNNVSTWFAENQVLANDSVSLSIRSGEVHALVGENGAGKSTLMHVLSGYRPPTSGGIEIDGAAVRFTAPSDAIANGVVMVHQHPPFVPFFRVWENLALGTEWTTPIGTLDRTAAAAAIRRTAEKYGIAVDPDARMGRLAASRLHFVAVLGALLRAPRLLILDEPTAPCTEPEVDKLFAALRMLAADGIAVVLITHKLKEVMQIADRVTVMRAGALVATVDRRETTAAEIASMMLGEDCQITDLDRRILPSPPAATPRSTLELRDVTVHAGDLPVLDRINLTATSGTILGVTGIRENGLEFLEEVLSGTIAPDAGTILLNGIPVARYTPRHFRRIGISYIPTDRILRGSSMDSSVAENLILLHRKGLQRGGLLRRKAVEQFAEKLKRRYDIAGPLHQPMRRLSGGNIQKVILSRELSGRRLVVVFSEPSWGLDIRSRNRVYEEMDALRSEGAVVILISADIDEVLSMSDRIAVMFRGRVAALLEADERTRERIGELMLGVEREGADV